MAVQYLHLSLDGSGIRGPRHRPQAANYTTLGTVNTMSSIPRSRSPAAPAPWQKPDSVGLVEAHDFAFAAPPHEMVLESGRRLGPITIRYETYGALNAARSNAVLIFHATSGSHHAAGYHTAQDRRPGWWDAMIGPGKAFDTERYYVVCTNFIGGCHGSTGPASIDPTTGEPYGLNFPVITIGDMVQAQVEVVRHLDLPQLYCVAGGSMGGMQALEWTVRFPDLVRSAIILASTATISAQGIAFHAIGRNAITTDPGWHDGNYYGRDHPRRGLATARMVGHLTYLSDESLGRRFGRKLQERDRFEYDFSHEFEVESYLDYKGTQFAQEFDANAYLYITKAMDYYNLNDHAGGLTAALAPTSAKFLLASFTSDWLYPSTQSKAIVSALMQNGNDVSYVEIDSPHGHDSFLIETERQTRIIRSFLASVG